MKNLIAVAIIGLSFIATPIFAGGAEMSRDFRNNTGVKITGSVKPHYTVCEPDLRKDEKGSLSTKGGTKNSRCYTYKGDPEPPQMRDH